MLEAVGEVPPQRAKDCFAGSPGLFRRWLEAVIVPAEMAEEMSGREPTFCCFKDGLEIWGRERQPQVLAG